MTLALIFGHFPLLNRLADTAYGLMPYCFAAFYADQFSKKTKNTPLLDPLVVWSVSALCAYVAYQFFPVAGPVYAFTSHFFPLNMPPADFIPLTPTMVTPVARNGAPSMHLGWAMILWLLAHLAEAPRWRAFFAIVVGLTVIATLGKGEHYAIDLVVAVPFVVGVLGLCSHRLEWNSRSRFLAIALGFGVWVSWVILLRTSIVTFVAHPPLAWLAVIATIFVSMWLFGRLRLSLKQTNTALSNFEASGRELPATKQVALGAQNSHLKIAGMFVASGFAGLMYEVIFSKSLALTFGSTSTAAYTVLATYMGGMALGTWLGAKFAGRTKHVILAYAGCEFFIGLYSIATPVLFAGVQYSYVLLASDTSPDASQLTGLRVALGGAVLLLPTMMMGATLPLLVSHINSHVDSLGRSVAILYSANTFGAAAGAFLTGYIIIPSFGLSSSLLLAALINFLVAFAAIGFHKQNKQVTRPMPPAEIRQLVSADTPTSSQRNAGVVAITVLTVGGIVTLALEVLYMHMLAVVVGNSTYAFSLMLATFLVGLGAGAEFARRTLCRIADLRYLMGCLQVVLAIFILGAVYVWDDIPDYFGSYAGYPVALGFGARELIRGIVAFLVMFPPAFIIGAAYPVAMECVGRAWPLRRVRMLGVAASLNTLGNITGVFLAGFVLLPFTGALHSIQVMGFVVVCMSMWLFIGSKARRWKFVPLAAIALTAAYQPTSFNYDKLITGANVYFSPQNFGHVIAKAESVDGGLTTVSETIILKQKLRTLLTNGKFQGNDSIGGEMVAQAGFAFAPLLHTEKRDSALVIGFGTGVTTRTLHAAGFETTDVVDLSADIVDMARKYFTEVNDDVLNKPGVNIKITDGRNYLLLQPTQYDVIGLEVSSIWFAGAAALYNQEFYRLAKARLRPNGVLQQWVQLHHITPIDIMYIIGSIKSEFEYVWVYEIGGQGIVIASNDPARGPNETAMRLLETTPSLTSLRDIVGESPAVLARKLVLGPDDVNRMLSSSGVPPSHWISTDNNMFLEYSTPRGNVLDATHSFDANYAFMRKFSGTALSLK